MKRIFSPNLFEQEIEHSIEKEMLATIPQWKINLLNERWLIFLRRGSEKLNVYSIVITSIFGNYITNQLYFFLYSRLCFFDVLQYGECSKRPERVAWKANFTWGKSTNTSIYYFQQFIMIGIWRHWSLISINKYM